MSQVKVRTALEETLAAMTPALATALENVRFTPPAANVPYQKAFVLFAEPDDPEAGHSLHFERGIFQVTLMYPLQTGDGTARARAEAIRAIFYRGASFTNSGITVVVVNTPEAGQGVVEDGRWSIPVKIRFLAQI